MNSVVKKIFKIIGILILVLLVGFFIVLYRFSTPKSDTSIKKEFSENNTEVYINRLKFKNFKFRVLQTQKKIDSLKPTIIFVHGSIGSSLDFKKYMFDVELKSKANLISYDRVGYGVDQTGEVQESIKFETALLEDLILQLGVLNPILVGYSYGGPIALASKKQYKKIVLLAPAVIARVEPMPWAINFYKWKATRWILPKAWQAASKEKLSHKKDLLNYDDKWNENQTPIICVQGNGDWIVPYENSTILKGEFPSKQFKLITLENVGHELIWSNFEDIKQVLKQQLN
ncbi:alpha/beta fold hydrolase [Lutibacter citreus]|uniref:alpha/beta fold hydrolase n=1 Tax=Lutibacter citreus TaxID=2138210 RepID=UPI000DBEA5F1|nr:alpha/beta hydrolase [Lutibacter citreus]